MRFHQFYWKIFVFSIGICLLHRDVAASSYDISPTSIDLSVDRTSEMVTLTNTSEEVLRFQVDVFRWSQTENNSAQLDPTKDIIAYPRIVSIPPKGARRLRIGLSRSAKRWHANGTQQKKTNAIEKTYRLIIDQLPEKRKKRTAGSSLRMLTRMSVPIFLASAHSKPILKMSKMKKSEDKAGELTFQISNRGNRHAKISSLKVSGHTTRHIATSGNTGKAVSPSFTTEIPAWYLLANSAHAYTFSLPKKAAICGALRSLMIQAETTEKKVVRSSFSMPAGACVAQ